MLLFVCFSYERPLLSEYDQETVGGASTYRNAVWRQADSSVRPDLGASEMFFCISVESCPFILWYCDTWLLLCTVESL